MNESKFANRLLDDETILWSGKPVQGLRLNKSDGLLIPFSFLWGGFAVFWETMVLRQVHTPPIFKLWGIPFVLIGLYLMVGRFLVDAYVRRGTDYAITNRRVLISRSSPFNLFVAIDLDRLPICQLTEEANSRGTIRFGQPQMMGRGFKAWTPSLDPTPQFIAIDSAALVFDQIQRLARVTQTS